MQVIVKESPYRDTAIVRFQGKTDSVPMLSVMHGPVRAKQNIILNLHAVEDFSSIHVGQLLITRRQLDSINRRFLLVAVPKHVQQVMTMSGCAGHFETYDSEAEALQTLKGGESTNGEG